MKQVRLGVFETNSSSTHTIVISEGNYYIPKQIEFNFYTGEYGWEGELYNSFEDKVSYALTYAVNYGTRKDLSLLDKVLEETGAIITYNGYTYDELLTKLNEETYHSDFGYIDHQSVDDASEIFVSEENLVNFLFSRYSYFETDNDNH